MVARSKVAASSGAGSTPPTVTNAGGAEQQARRQGGALGGWWRAESGRRHVIVGVWPAVGRCTSNRFAAGGFDRGERRRQTWITAVVGGRHRDTGGRAVEVAAFRTPMRGCRRQSRSSRRRGAPPGFEGSSDADSAGHLLHALLEHHYVGGIQPGPHAGEYPFQFAG